MTPFLRTAIAIYGFALCLLDVQVQQADNNIFAGNFMPDQSLWLQFVRYALCGYGLVVSVLAVISAPKKNVGFKRLGGLFVCLVIFCIATGIRSAMDMRNPLYVFATGSRHILTFALVAMAASLAGRYNMFRPLLMGAIPVFCFRFCYSLYAFGTGEGVEITGGIRSVALDIGVMFFSLAYLFIAISKLYEHAMRKQNTQAFIWFVISVPLLLFPIASFRRSMIVMTVGSLVVGVLLHAFANRMLVRRLLPVMAAIVIMATMSAGMFIALFGADVAVERLRSFALHDEGGFSESNEWYEKDSDYAGDLITRNPVAGIGFSTPYGFAGRDDENLQSFDTGKDSEIVLHVGMEELVVRQGIYGAAVWLIVFIIAPLRRVWELRSLGRPVSLIPCLFIAVFLIAANLPTAPPFYNEIRPAVFLGLWFGIGFADDPAAIFDSLPRATTVLRQIWSRQHAEPVAA